jgi:hypothetical protein
MYECFAFVKWFLSPPAHSHTKTIHIDDHEVGREQHGPDQLAPVVAPTASGATNEKDWINQGHVGCHCRNSQPNAGYHGKHETGYL